MYELSLKAMDISADESTIMRLVFDRVSLVLSTVPEAYIIRMEDDKGEFNTAHVLFESLPDHDSRTGTFLEGLHYREPYNGEFVLTLSDMVLHLYRVDWYTYHVRCYLLNNRKDYLMQMTFKTKGNL